MNAEAEMPRYRSHKIVHALKIAAIEFAPDGSAKIAPKDAGYGTCPVGPGYRAKFHGEFHSDDLGYLVVYPDGYVSWSPTTAFEEGYTRVES